MTNVEIITIISQNYGNRLQNYALQVSLEQLGVTVVTSRVKAQSHFILRKFRDFILQFYRQNDKELFAFFNTKIHWKKENGFQECDDEHIDYYIAGSDQIWNPYFEFNSDREFLRFTDKKKRIAYAASIGIDQIPLEFEKKINTYLPEFKNISVREDSAKHMISHLCKREVEVVLDPTMLLTAEQWEQVAHWSVVSIKEKFVVKYFLGARNERYELYIDEYARKIGATVIDITEHQKCKIQGIGPSEFIYLFLNCEAAFVDSYHGSVFSLLFHKPFLTFSRPSQEGFGNMNCRFDTLFRQFEIEDRFITDTDQLQKCSINMDYGKIEEILLHMREKSIMYLKMLCIYKNV